MKEILASSEMLDLPRELGKDCEHNPDLYYDFINEVHWPLFLAFVKTNRGVDYDSLPDLEQVDICIDPNLLTAFLKQTPRFHHFRSHYYFYKLSLADATDIDLFELSDSEVVNILNLSMCEKVEGPKLLGYVKRLFRRESNSTV